MSFRCDTEESMQGANCALTFWFWLRDLGVESYRFSTADSFRAAVDLFEVEWMSPGLPNQFQHRTPEDGNQAGNTLRIIDLSFVSLVSFVVNP
jgi:hypothetical protein